MSALINGAATAPIGLPCDDETYSGLTEAEAAAKVRELIAMGYRCDPSVADEIESEVGPPTGADGR